MGGCVKFYVSVFYWIGVTNHCRCAEMDVLSYTVILSEFYYDCPLPLHQFCTTPHNVNSSPSLTSFLQRFIHSGVFML